MTTLMPTVVGILLCQGVCGAVDTLYYHEWRVRLPGMGSRARSELTLHAMRDFAYAIIFAGISTVAWQGTWALALVAIMVAEVAITMADFAIEPSTRADQGDVPGGERILHGIMAILYGAFVASLCPQLREWLQMPTRLAIVDWNISQFSISALRVMAVGVLLSGIRDMCAAYDVRWARWPWGSANVRVDAR